MSTQPLLFSRPRTLGMVFRHGILGAVGLITVAPVFFTLATSLKSFKDIIGGALLFAPVLRNYQHLFDPAESDFLRLTFNSLATALGSTLFVVAAASLAAYSLSRFRWRRSLHAFFMAWLLLVNMLPPIVFVGPFYLMAQALGIYDSPLSVSMGHIVLNLPLGIWILFDFFAAVPKELEESANMDGATRVQTFARIVFPVARPGVAAASVLAFLFSWKDFLYALALTSTPAGMTIPVGIASLVQEYNIRYGEMAAAAFFASVPALIMVILAQRHIVKGMTLGAVKG